MPVRSYSKLPVTIQAIQYTNSQDLSNVSEILDFTDHKFRTRDVTEIGNSVITAEVYDELHDTWVGVKDGDYIIKGLQGEFYPHDKDLFPLAYTESVQQQVTDILSEVNPSR